MSEQGHQQQATAIAAVQKLKQAAYTLDIVPQVVYEYWAVVTRPSGSANGLGMTAPFANQAIQNWLKLYTLEHDPANIFDLWRQLITQHQVLGKPAHDARLVAALLFHGCDGIVTFNAADFRRYSPLQVLTPEQVLQA
jgi:predicted nucleic acid-binding protein